MAKVKKEKVSKVRVTLVGNVDLDAVEKALSVFPDLEVKVWKKRGRSAAKKAVETSPDVESA
jgi:hypothetical protein